MSLPVYACPFCGGGRLGMVQLGPVSTFVLVCGSCGAAGPVAGGPELAIQLWNRAERLKPDPAPLAAAPSPPKAAAQPVPEGRPYRGATDGLKTERMRFCGADTLISEPDGSVSVKRGSGCTCQKEGT